MATFRKRSRSVKSNPRHAKPPACPNCGAELVLWDVGEYVCPDCTVVTVNLLASAVVARENRLHGKERC